ncbi:MAG: CDC48 family AAA ATPase [Candidatus Altiarchaeales archaeon]|nr:CDC48 family AAA ATPase [Candidatus Altiarchaeales archaeon]MBD3416659.1 CDC48 family AAA ATPase [Candidatus Altiarchaeales archaeon]
MSEHIIELKVAEALQNDVGRGIVRIDSESARKLDVTTGDIVEVSGGRTTAAKVWQSHQEDEGKDIIRMDGLLRQNSGSTLGDKVKVRKAELKSAKKVVIAPTRHEISFGEDFSSYVKQRVLMGRPLISGDAFYITVLGQAISFTVASTKPNGIVKITEYTNLEVKSKPMSVTSVPGLAVRYEDIGGLRDEVGRVREMVELPMKHPELFEKLGIKPPKGVLLYGPPGTGKTLLAKAVASESNANFMHLNGPEIMDKFYGESERKLRDIFEEAQQNAPSIIFIDEIDSIAPKRDETKGEVERRVVAQLLALMDGLASRGNVIVVAATNRPDSLDPALRRPGRFDREIEIGVPDVNGRKEILQIHTRGMPLDDDVDLEKIGRITHGFVGADIEAIAREAAMHALKRNLPRIDLESDSIPAEVLESLKVTREDFSEAMKIVDPSALREVMVEVPNVKWNDIGGLKRVKQELVEAVEWPLKKPDTFKKLGIKAPNAVLLYGPPGCGKTMLAKAVATESEANFIAVKGPELLSMWVGESERGVREIFKKARQTAPTIIFFDEIDAIAPRRGTSFGSHVTETVVNQILTEIDGIERLENVMIIGASNRPDILDPSLLRPGRFDRLVLVPLPDREAREEVFKVHTKGMPLRGVNIEDLAKKTEGYTGADIESLCREAAMNSLREDMEAGYVDRKHFEHALEEITPSVTAEEAKSYENNLRRGRRKDEQLPAYG